MTSNVKSGTANLPRIQRVDRCEDCKRIVGDGAGVGLLIAIAFGAFR